MKNMRIGARLLLGFGVVLALTVGVGIYALVQQESVRRFMSEMNDRDLQVLQTINQLSDSEDQMRASREMALTNALLLKDKLGTEGPEGQEALWRQNRERNIKLLSDLEQATGGYENSALTAGRAEKWRSIRLASRDSRDALNALSPEVERIFALINRGEIAAAYSSLPAVERIRESFDSKLDQAQRLTEEQISIGRSEVEAYFARARTSLLAGLVAAILLGIFCSALIQRSITRPLAVFRDFAERVGKGDLTTPASADGRDELAELARSFNQMLSGLRDVAGQTRGVVENLSAATAEILASTQQQAANTAEQSAAVQQANATMSELSQSGSQISEKARQVAAAAEATSSATMSGLQSVQDTGATMESIREQAEAVAERVIALSEKTQAIGEIIATVNDIAEQSHLLALNAAIESAAAGDHGRRFSVVASEMKNLADQSKQATVQVRSILGEIQKSITNSVMLTEEAVKRVESGRQQAGVADRTIRSLAGNIQESVQAFQQIVAGSGQQQIGFEQVTQAFRSIGVASEQTATSTRQSEKAALN
ncbi:MAG: methyl-accepting chemotaxis protein, partial [Acidobacteriia bacterium]|nr:methyl-accepting chemotaxis protein [Terriglobia bacterium]